MKELSQSLTGFLERYKYKPGDPRHDKAELVNELAQVIDLNKTYSYTYWLGKLKQFENCGGQLWMVRDWLKQIKGYPGNFKKGAILTNRFKKFADEYKELQKKRQSNSQATL